MCSGLPFSRTAPFPSSCRWIPYCMIDSNLGCFLVHIVQKCTLPSHHQIVRLGTPNTAIGMEIIRGRAFCHIRDIVPIACRTTLGSPAREERLTSRLAPCALYRVPALTCDIMRQNRLLNVRLRFTRHGLDQILSS